jgi:hypothetical protein
VRSRFSFCLILGLAGCFAARPQTATSQRVLDFSCSTFPATTTEEELVRRFGSDYVRSGPVAGGGAEGEYTQGTILFPETIDAKVEILWKVRELKRAPYLVWIVGRQSRWRSPEGITLGTDLRTVERVNRRPFRMAGFGFDGSGTVISWAGGRLAVPDSAGCRMRLGLDLRFEPAIGTSTTADRATLSRQVTGDRQYFSSGHRAMQTLNPRTYKMFLEYDR